MAYTDLKATIAQRLLIAKIDPGIDGITGTQDTDALDAINFLFGTTTGKVNLIGIAQGTASAAPATIDLSAFDDPYNAAKAWAKVVALLVLNYATNDAHELLIDLSVTNGWTAPLDGASGKIVVPPGFTDPSDSSKTRPGGVLIWGGNTSSLAVGGSSKVISLDPGANAIAYRVYALGRDA